MLEALAEEAQVTVDSWLTTADDLCPQQRRGRRLARLGTEYDGMAGDERWGRSTQHRRGRQLVS